MSPMIELALPWPIASWRALMRAMSFWCWRSTLPIPMLKRSSHSTYFTLTSGGPRRRGHA
jgi:hypothetical protein